MLHIVYRNYVFVCWFVRCLCVCALVCSDVIMFIYSCGAVFVCSCARVLICSCVLCESVPVFLYSSACACMCLCARVFVCSRVTVFVCSRVHGFVCSCIRVPGVGAFISSCVCHDLQRGHAFDP